MKPGWKYCQLEDAVTKGSSNISLNKVKGEAGKYALFAAQGFVQNVSFFHQEQEYLAIIKDGAGIGRVSKHPAKSSVVATMQYIIPKDGFDIDFIKYFLEGIDFEKYRKGSTIPHVYFKDYKSEKFPKLSLPEQQCIVSILDEAFATIEKAKANAQQNLKNAKELFNCILDSILDDKKWQVRQLGEVCEKVEYGTSSKAQPQGELPVLRMGNIQNGRFVWDNLAYSNNKNDNRQYLLQYNDVLFNRTNSPELVGKTAIYKGERPAIFAGYLIRIHRKMDLLDADYLNYYLNSKMAFEYGKTVVISSVNQANINGTKLKTYPIPLPSLQEQQTIVQQLDVLRAETQKLEAIYQNKIDDLEELKKSILRKAFAGELTSSIHSNTAIPNSTPLDKVEGISPTDLQAGITAIALKRHTERNHQHSFHHVKVEKIVHLAEYILNIDLERNPVKDAAGPNDFPHAKKVESRARKAGYYTVFKNGEFYDYREGSKINSIIQKAHNSLGEKATILFQILDMLVPLNTQQAEIVATVYAAWNNLIKAGEDFSDEEIVKEAREDWHVQKLKIPREKFFKAIEWMKKQELLVPTGNGKFVIPK